eukprot:SAG11_NODE_503_length_8890_cov_30.658628_7_plen_45_part_00
MQQYRESKADKCIVCSKPIMGSYYPTDNGKVCAEGDCLAQSKDM